MNTIHIRALRTLYGPPPVEALTHPDMLTLRDHLVGRGLARVTVNGHLTSVRQLFKWALDEALISAMAKAELTQVANLRPFRSAARETKPVRAVPDDVVERTCAALPESLADMVRVHRLTGMRPGEVCGLAWDRIERIGDVWAYRPEHHKNEWRRQVWVVALGPRAQAILRKYEGAEGCIFSPARAVLGHSCGMRVTDRYSFEAAEEEALRDASPAMLELG